jgi:hypothetical protein
VKRLATCAATLLLTAVAARVAAQAPGFGGTWRLDPGRSRLADTAGLAGLAAAGAPVTIHVTQPNNGTLVVESQINEGHARLYRPGARITTPVTVGPAGGITMTSRWQGGALVAEGIRDYASDAPPTQVKEVLSLSADAAVLTIEVTTAAAGQTRASTLVYTRTRDLGPCQTWPTPCGAPRRR